MKWKHTVNDIISNHWNTVNSIGLNTHQIRHLNNISKCHTEALGGILLNCNKCGNTQYQYHSCRNRHCPSCQGSKREEWIERQQNYLLDVPYFHVVFTLPSELRSLALHKPRIIYNLLFKSSWETIATLSKDEKFLKAQSGMTAVLHTWSQNLGLHPHLHCIIPGGGLAKDGKWKNTRSKGKYLFPAKIMSMIFKAIFMRKLKDLVENQTIELDAKLRNVLYRRKWVVYAKRPFANPAHVIEYLGRYTHKIAISNYRILDITDSHVIFKWKDYRHGSVNKTMKLTVAEFIRRFAMHILPHRFVRIRHFGILSFHARNEKIQLIQQSQNFTPPVVVIIKRPTVNNNACKICKNEKMITTILQKQHTRSP